MARNNGNAMLQELQPLSLEERFERLTMFESAGQNLETEFGLSIGLYAQRIGNTLEFQCTLEKLSEAFEDAHGEDEPINYVICVCDELGHELDVHKFRM